jgi:hypothetical protein
VPGQPYQIPAGYESYPAGTLIEYGGNNYVTQSNGTMLLQTPPGTQNNTAQSNVQSNQPYQVPAGFEGSPAGSVIDYGGNNYVIQGDGTMLAVSAGGSGTADNSGGDTTADNSGNYVPEYSSPDSSGYADNSSGYVDNTAYQIPSGYESSYAAGTPISYGGYDYIAQGNGTMFMVNSGLGLGYSGIGYQIPAGYAGRPVGSAINYGGAHYVVNSGGTMNRVNPNGQPFGTGPGPGVRPNGIQPGYANATRPGLGPQIRPGGIQPGYANATRPGLGPQIRPNTTGTTVQPYRSNAPTQTYRPSAPAQTYRPSAPAQTYRPSAPAQTYRPSTNFGGSGGGGYSRGYSRAPSMPSVGAGRR